MVWAGLRQVLRAASMLGGDLHMVKCARRDAGPMHGMDT